MDLQETRYFPCTLLKVTFSLWVANENLRGIYDEKRCLGAHSRWPISQLVFPHFPLSKRTQNVGKCVGLTIKQNIQKKDIAHILCVYQNVSIAIAITFCLSNKHITSFGPETSMAGSVFCARRMISNFKKLTLSWRMSSAVPSPFFHFHCVFIFSTSISIDWKSN